MNQLLDHNNSLKMLFSSLTQGYDIAELEAQVSLDEIDKVLRRVLSIADMRQSGCFFTGDELATEVASSFQEPITRQSVILDPTCGAGNLLIACSRLLGVSELLSETLEQWGRMLRGYDLYPSFVESTKLRLILEAINQGSRPDCSVEEALELLVGVETLDAMSASITQVARVTHVIMNPPFSIWESPKRDFWRQGKVNAAAVIFEHYSRILPDNCNICAILPEVLRSGSRYGDWRNFVETRVAGTTKVIGQFNSKTNVDVFTLYGKQCLLDNAIDWHINTDSNYIPLSNSFDVSVGRLVAYRDPEEGESYPYIHPKNVPLWKTIDQFSERRRFLGTVIHPPFVVIKRTSSPSDKFRASGAIIAGKEPIAVENHLIIVKPKSNMVADCRALLNVLKSPQTNNFLNSRIRCRHLTVDAVKQIPYKQVDRK
jgi:hypothetical protein